MPLSPGTTSFKWRHLCTFPVTGTVDSLWWHAAWPLPLICHCMRAGVGGLGGGGGTWRAEGSLLCSGPVLVSKPKKMHTRWEQKSKAAKSLPAPTPISWADTEARRGDTCPGWLREELVEPGRTWILTHGREEATSSAPTAFPTGAPGAHGTGWALAGQLSSSGGLGPMRTPLAAAKS